MSLFIRIIRIDISDKARDMAFVRQVLSLAAVCYEILSLLWKFHQTAITPIQLRLIMVLQFF